MALAIVEGLLTAIEAMLCRSGKCKNMNFTWPRKDANLIHDKTWQAPGVQASAFVQEQADEAFDIDHHS